MTRPGMIGRYLPPPIETLIRDYVDGERVVAEATAVGIVGIRNHRLIHVNHDCHPYFAVNIRLTTLMAIALPIITDAEKWAATCDGHLIRTHYGLTIKDKATIVAAITKYVNGQ